LLDLKKKEKEEKEEKIEMIDKTLTSGRRSVKLNPSKKEMPRFR
jgi:hypothetical protein